MATRRRGRALIFVIIFLLLLLVLIWAAYTLYLAPMLNPAPAPQATVPTGPVPTATLATQVVDIVMTSQNIPRGKVIDESVVTTVPIPVKDYVQGTFFEKVEDVVGKRARYNLQPRTPLTDALLVDPELGPASFDIPKGMVAISVPISKLSSVSYALQSGDHVDIIVSLLIIDLDQQFQTRLPNKSEGVTNPGKLSEQFNGTAIITDPTIVGRADFDSTIGAPIYNYPSEEQRPRLVSTTLIRDVIILHVGLFPQGDASFASNPSGPDLETGQPQPTSQPQAGTAIAPPDVMTIVVSPQDAITINYLLLAGARLNYVMRNPEDDNTAAMQSSTLQFIMDQYSIVNPAKLPYGIEPRTDNFLTNNNIIPPFPEAGSPVTSLPTVTPIPVKGPAGPMPTTTPRK